MKLRTTFPIRNVPKQKISIGSCIVSMGSCFSDNVGNLLKASKLRAISNPLGITFNPISLVGQLEWALGNQELNPQHFLEKDRVWRHFDLHSSVQATSKTELLEELEKKRSTLKNWLEKTDFLLLTFGTAWVYERKITKQIVANCHKVPNKQFCKRLLTAGEIQEAVCQLKTLLPHSTQLVLTVSPIRHAKDTMELNAVSKSTLRLACHQLTENQESTHYFPSYELLLDDLRDYRFYEADLLHPNSTAVAYIWEQFAGSYFDAELQEFLKEWKLIKSDLAHRAFAPQSEAHQKFLKSLLKKLKNVSKKVDVRKEMEKVEGQIV